MRAIPFEVRPDPLYSEYNMLALEESLEQASDGQFVTKTPDELFATSDEGDAAIKKTSAEAALKAIQNALTPLAAEKGIVTDEDVIALIDEYRQRSHKE